MKHIHAVIGLIINKSDNEVLLAQRQEGQSYAGYWELPGGKIEFGESISSALVRELEEELGIVVKEHYFIETINYQYPEFKVKLEVYKIINYSGTVIGKEGQAITWVSLDNIDSVTPLLPASHQLLNSINL